MSRKFRIPQQIPKPPTSTTKSIRFPNEIVEAVERAICGTGCSFTAFVMEAVRVALLDLEDRMKDEVT